MSTRLDYLIQKLDDLEAAIRREKREYDKARDRYDKMRSRDIIDNLKEQVLGYQSEHDKLQSARSSREKERRDRPPPPPPPQHHQQPSGRSTRPANTQQSQQQRMPHPPEYRPSYPHRPAPQHDPGCPPRNNHGPGVNGAGQARGQPSQRGAANHKPRPAPPRPHQKTQMVDYEVEEPDGQTYIVRGGSVFRDFDPARDKIRETG